MTVRAAQYVRMSTDMQDCSITYQVARNATFAAESGFEIVRTYADEGISGLTLHQRPGLQSLLADVIAGAADLSAVLVFDVSRWGRFQNPDESAHYEFMCAKAGVPVLYTSDPTLNDGSLAATLVKSIKRFMAAEYSRELSIRMIASRRSLQSRGYWAAGPAPYGYSRQLVHRSGELGRVLVHDEQCPRKGTHTILVRGTDEEVETVREVFRRYTRGRYIEEIADQLRAAGSTRRGARWKGSTIQYMLRNELYCGTHVIGRHLRSLGVTIDQPADQQLRIQGFVEPLVTKAVFRKAQQEQSRRHRSHAMLTRGQLLHQLRELLKREGRLSSDLITKSRSCACVAVFRREFGSLAAAYRAVEWVPGPWQLGRMAVLDSRLASVQGEMSDRELLGKAAQVLANHGQINIELLRSTHGVPPPALYMRRFGGMARVYELLGYEPNPRARAALRQPQRSRGKTGTVRRPPAIESEIA